MRLLLLTKSPPYVHVKNCLIQYTFILEFDIKNHKILFEDRKGDNQQILFDGIPFIIIGNQLSQCIHGKNYHATSKKKLQDQNLKERVRVTNSVERNFTFRSMF